MKYRISLMGCPLWVRMLKLEGAQADICMQFDDLDSMWEETEKNYGDYDVEAEILTCRDRLEISVVDEEGRTVFCSGSLDDIAQYPLLDEDGRVLCLDGYSFQGVEDGTYLVSQQSMMGSCWEAEIVLDGAFDASRLYLLRDVTLDDEFCGEDCFPIGVLYYRRGDDAAPDADRICMDFISDNGSHGCYVNISSVREKDWWQLLKE